MSTAEVAVVAVALVAEGGRSSVHDGNRNEMPIEVTMNSSLGRSEGGSHFTTHSSVPDGSISCIIHRGENSNDFDALYSGGEEVSYSGGKVSCGLRSLIGNTGLLLLSYIIVVAVVLAVLVVVVVECNVGFRL